MLEGLDFFDKTTYREQKEKKTCDEEIEPWGRGRNIALFFPED